MLYSSGTAIGAGNCTASDAVWFSREKCNVYNKLEQTERG